MIPTTQVDFAVRSKSLQTQTITELLGVQPTRAFDKGEEYIGKQKTANGIESVKRIRPFGVWHFCTAGLVESNMPHEHASFMLEKLESAFTEIRELCRNSNYFVNITIWYAGPDGFSMPADLLRRLAILCEEVAITCWEVEEA